MILAAFIIAIGYGIITPILPQYTADFGVGAFAVSAVISAFGVFRLIFAPLAGKLTQRLGENPVYVVGILIVAVSMFATAFAPSYELLLIFRSVGGIGSTFFTVSAMAYIARKSPPRIRGRVAGAYASSFMIGSLTGPLMGSLLVAFGQRVPFLVYGFALVAAAAVVAVMLRASRIEDRRTKDTREFATVSKAWADPSYRAALAAGFVNGWTSLGVRNSLVPLFAAAAFTGGAWFLESEQLAGVVLTAFAAGNVAVVLTLAKRSDSWGRRPPLIVGFSVAGVTTACLGLAPEPWILVLLSLIAGAGTGLLVPAQQAAVADIVGEGRNGGSVISTFQMTQDLGAIVGPLVAGLLVDQVGYVWAFGLSGLIMLVGAAAWAAAPDTLPRGASTV
ncbi:MFS transporter [Nesterenkonia sp. Hz 6-5]|nr:MFS transporter [Nesterenkonia haasae]